MIYVERSITVGNDKSSIEKPVLLYKGDKNVKIQFTIKGNPFKYSNESEPAYAQLLIKRPEADPIISEVFKYESSKVVFVITGEMIDELTELGSYTLQLRLYNADKTSRVTLPPINAGIIIEEPIYEEDYAAAIVNEGVVNYNLVSRSSEIIAVFDDDGNYKRVEWKHGDIITDSRLNHIENALYEINDSKAVKDHIHEQYITEHQDLSAYALKADIEAADYASKDYVDIAMESVEVDLSDYVTTESMNAALADKADEEHTHDEYLTEHQDISNLATKEELNTALGDIESLLKEI